MTIYSEEGHGTTVNLYLPVGDMAEVSTEIRQETIANGARDQAIRVLVVEDQAQVRSHVVRTLKRFGYRVEAAEDAASALQLLKQNPSFDLLFTDIVMPGGMNGQALGEVAKEFQPLIKVLYTSGYPAAAFEHLGLRQQSSINLLRKPYRAAELKEAITRVLGED